MIPLILKIKKKVHKDIALAQDLVIEELYKVFNNAVLHGGTAIWRCYNGNRFSEDIDVYISKNIERISLLFENLKKKGFVVKKKRIRENSLFSVIELNGTIIRFEALFKKIRGSLKEYENCDSNFLTIYTLLPEEIIREKVDTYLKRFKIRDLYDIFFLLRYVENKRNIQKNLAELIKDFKEPVDKKNLNILILEGIVPDFNKMLSYIKRYS